MKGKLFQFLQYYLHLVRRVYVAYARSYLFLERSQPFLHRADRYVPSVGEFFQCHCFWFHRLLYVLYYHKIMLVGLRLGVYLVHRLLQSFIVHHVVFAFLRVIGGGKDAEMCREGVEHGRDRREAVSAADEIDVFLSQRQKELLHIDAVAGTDVRLAVVEYQKTVHEIGFDILQYLFLAVADDTPCAPVSSDTFRKVEMHERNILPLVFVRRDYECAPSVGESLTEHLAQDRGLPRSRFPDEHHLKHLTRRFFLLLRSFRLLLFLLLRQLRKL